MSRRLPLVAVVLACAFAGGLTAEWALRSPPTVSAEPPLPLPPAFVGDAPPPPEKEPPLAAGVPRFDAAVQKVMPSVVAVDAVKPALRGTRGGEESGSGVLLRFDGFRNTYVVTNNHVVTGSRAADVTVTLNDGRILIPDQLWTDPESDIALLKVTADDLVPAAAGDSDRVKPGHWVLAFGSPLGFNQTVTHGIVSARDRGQVTLNNTIRIKEFLQSDAAINPGSSGGPLTDDAGRVIGINSAIASGGKNEDPAFTGISFSIPINLVKRVARDLLDKGAVARGYLGLQMAATLDSRTALKLGLTKLRGAMVESTHPSGPAARGGLQAGDVILKVDGVDVRDENHFINIVGGLPVGQTVKLSVWRGKQPKTAELTVSDWPASRR